jgi:hypothetical protein
MQLGAIGAAGKTDQPLPVNSDLDQASEQPLHGDLSMQLAEHGRERQREDFEIEIVADMQRPVASLPDLRP